MQIIIIIIIIITTNNQAQAEEDVYFGCIHLLSHKRVDSILESRPNKCEVHPHVREMMPAMKT